MKFERVIDYICFTAGASVVVAVSVWAVKAILVYGILQ